MSCPQVKAARRKYKVRLAKAVSQFEADLSTEQKTTFNSYKVQSYGPPTPDISDVMRLTAEVDRRTAGKVGGGRCFGPRLTNFLQAVQLFTTLGDTTRYGSKNMVAFDVWSVVRMTILLVMNFSSYSDKVSKLIMSIGRSAPYYPAMVLLNQRSTSLQPLLSEYFIVVVGFCRQLLELTRKSEIEQPIAFLSESDIKTYQLDFELWANSIKQEVNLLMAQELEEQRLQIKKLSRLSTSDKPARAYLRILDSCSTYDYQTTWKEIRKVGNATLLDNAREYQDWRVGTDSSTLICTGKLGSGKSVLLANMVDDLYLRGGGLLVAYFFCRHDIPESLRARTVIGSLARQLFSEIRQSYIKQESFDTNPPVLDSKGILHSLQSVIPFNYRAYLVIDGLDECDEYQKQEVIFHLQQLQGMFSMLVCLSFRSEADTTWKGGLDQFAKPSTISIPDNNPDIANFINLELERCIESGKLKIGEPTLILEIQEVLLKGARGIFLWVVLQIDALCAAKTDEAIHQALAGLPKDLPSTFSRVLRKSEGTKKLYQRRILELITAAYRPLTIEEVREALSVIPGETVWDPARLLDGIHSALGCCGSLIVIDEENLTVKLIHGSVKYFLLGGFGGSSSEILTIESANKTMREIIITYLNYGIFETQLSTIVVPQLMARAAPSTVIHLTLESLSWIHKTILRLLKSRDQSSLNIGKVLTDESTRFDAQPTSQYGFFFYAVSHWFQHSRYISEQEPVMYRLLQHLLGGNIIDMHMRDEDGWTILLWAAEKGHEAVVRTLLKKGADIEAKDKDGQTPLWHAAARGDEAVVRILLDKGSDMEAKNKHGQTPLLRAAKTWQGAAVRILLDKGANIEARDNVGRTPLSHAAAEGYEGTVRILVDNGADIESKDKIGRTPLLHAGAGGHVAAARILLERGADIEAKDNNGQTSLSYAAEKGYEPVVQTLLDKGADIEAKDKDGQTPLWHAAARGDEAIARILLDKGSDMEAKNKHGQTPLLRAAKAWQGAAVRMLLGKGADIEAKDKDGRTPLSHAAIGELRWSKEYEAVVQILLYKGANIESKDKNGRTPLLHAAVRGHEAAVRTLLEKGADIEAKDKIGQTSLLYAVVGELGWGTTPEAYEAVVRILLDKGADTEAKDKVGRTPLWHAVEKGYEPVVQTLLDKGADIETRSWDGQTLLLQAAGRGQEAAVRILLDKGADIEARDKFGQTPLLQAIYGRLFLRKTEEYERGGRMLCWDTKVDCEAVVRTLLNKGADIEARDWDGQTPLLQAAKTGQQFVVRMLLDKGAAAKARDWDGQTSLFWAARRGQEAVVRILLDEGGIDIEAKNKHGWTPLSRAAAAGNAAVVQMLLDKGADIEAKDKVGQTPLSRAVVGKWQWDGLAREHEAVVRTLLGKGANIEARDNAGRTPLSHAAAEGYEPTVRILVDNGADTEAKGEDGWTPLLHAAAGGHEAAARILLERGADTEAKDKVGWTPLLWAIEQRHAAVMRTLLDKGADTEVRDKIGQTPLFRAAERWDKSVVRTLLAKGAHIEARDADARTPLVRAAERGREAVVRTLLKKGADMEAKDKDGRTALLHAAMRGHEAAVRILLGRGADINAKDNSGRTSLSYVLEGELWRTTTPEAYRAVIRILLDKGADIKAKDKVGQTPLSRVFERENEAIETSLRAPLSRSCSVASNSPSTYS